MSPHNGFGRGLAYISAASRRPDFIASTFPPDATIPEIAQVFNEQAALNPRCRKPILHAVISLRSHDGASETLSPAEWQKVIGTYLRELGFEGCPFVAYRHNNTDTEHVHIIASRVRPDRKVVNDYNDHSRGVAVLNALSKELGLTTVREPGQAPDRALSLDEIAAATRTVEPNLRLELQDHLRAAVTGRPDWSTFTARLLEVGVTVHPHTSFDGTLRGLSYAMDGVSFKASAIGRAYTPAGLRKTFELPVPERLDPSQSSTPPSPRPRSDPRIDLQLILREATLGRPDSRMFGDRLAAAGVELLPHGSNDGVLRGLSYRFQGTTFKASDIGRSYSPQGLAKHFGIHLQLAPFDSHRPDPGTAAPAVSGPDRDLRADPAPLSSPRFALAPPGGAATAPPAAAPVSGWSPAALGQLERELRRSLEVPSPELHQALQALRGRPAEAIRTTGSAWSLALAATSSRPALSLAQRQVMPASARRVAAHTFGLVSSFVSPKAALAYTARLLLAAPFQAAASAPRRASLSPSLPALLQSHDAGIVRAYCAAASSDRPSWPLFLQRLDEAGIGVASPPANAVRSRFEILFTLEPRVGGPISSTVLGPEFTLRGFATHFQLSDVPQTLAPLSPLPSPHEAALRSLGDLPDVPATVIVTKPGDLAPERISVSSPRELAQLAPDLLARQEAGATLTLRPAHAACQVLSDLPATAIETAREKGWNPCLLAQTAPDRFTVWLWHPETPGAPDPTTLQATLRQTAAAAFGASAASPAADLPLAPLVAAARPQRPVPAPPEPAAPRLSTLLEAHQLAVAQASRAELQRLGLPSFAQYRETVAAPYGQQLREWTRFAQQRGASPLTILRELAHFDRRSPVPAASRLRAALHRLTGVISPTDLRLFLRAVHPLPALALRGFRYLLNTVVRLGRST